MTTPLSSCCGAEIKLNIQSHCDREKIISSLANSGYSVYVSIEPDQIKRFETYYVVFSVGEKAINKDFTCSKCLKERGV